MKITDTLYLKSSVLLVTARLFKPKAAGASEYLDNRTIGLTGNCSTLIIISGWTGFWGFGEQYVTEPSRFAIKVTYCSPKPQNPLKICFKYYLNKII